MSVERQVSLSHSAAAFVYHADGRRSASISESCLWQQTWTSFLSVDGYKSKCAAVNKNKRLDRGTVLLKLTTDRHEASRGLSATAELFVFSLLEIWECVTLEHPDLFQKETGSECEDVFYVVSHVTNDVLLLQCEFVDEQSHFGRYQLTRCYIPCASHSTRMLSIALYFRRRGLSA